MKETSGRKRMAVQTIYKYRQYSIQISELLKKRGALQRKDRGERFAVASGKLNWLKYRYFSYKLLFTILPVHVYYNKECTHILATSHTLTEWLWKSVTTISFLLFTATKWGPGSSRGEGEGRRGKMSHPLLNNISEEVPHYFWTLKTKHTVVTETLRVHVGQYVRHDRADALTCKKNKDLFF